MRSMPVRQVPPWKVFPSGDYRPLLELRFNPDELEQRYGLHFVAEHDNLDLFKLAAIALSDGTQAWLTQYRGEQGMGTVISVDLGENFAWAKRAIQQAMDLQPGDITWVSPFVAHPERKPAPPRQQSAS